LAFKIARNLSGFGPHPDATHQPDRRAPKTSSPPKTRRTLSPSAGATLNNVFDIDLLSGRLAAVTSWVRDRRGCRGLPVGYFGASTGAAAALCAAADDPEVAAVVTRGGRPDLAAPRLGAVRAPTLLVVGGRDVVVLELNRWAQAGLRCQSRLAVVPGATHLFEEPGTLEQAATLARDWFVEHLDRRTAERAPAEPQPMP